MTKFLKDIKFDTQARESLLKGMNVVADAVGSTLGPRGRNVAVDQYQEVDVPPTVLHDGVSVARSINLPDNFEDMGARLLKDAALQTNEKAGDGTTTATILAQAIVKEAVKNIEAGSNPMVLKAEIEEATKCVLAELKRLSKKIASDTEIEQVATISAADPNIGNLVSQALRKVGKDGVITVEEGKTMETEVEYKQGMEINQGYLSPYFVSEHEKEAAIIDDPYILLTDKKLNYGYVLQPFLENFLKTGHKNLVVFAGDLIEEGMQMLVVNKLRGVLNVVAVQAPAFGDRRIDELEDLATLVGGHAILEDSGTELKSVNITELGKADKVVVTKESTVILNGHGNKKHITRRVDELREQIKISTNDYDRQVKEERLAKLAGSVAIIHVGAATEVELKEKKERVIDAVAATKAAVEEGIIAGGEVTLLYMALRGLEGAFEATGGKILREALKAPFKQLTSNAGFDYAEVLQKLSGKEYPMGIDVLDGEIKDMIKSGIIDPVKVTRSALENAVSVAVMACTTNTLIVDLPKEKE